MFDVQITIPSRSRASSQKTIYSLSEDLWPLISLVVPEEQYNDYRAAQPTDIKVIPFTGKGIGPKREFMLHLKPTGKLIMMDDDLRFYKRLEDGRFTIAMPKDTEKMITAILELLDYYPHVGIVDKLWSQTKPRNYAVCQRFNQVLCFNRDTMPDPWPSFRLSYAHEEHDIHLQFLTRGYETAVSTEWSKSDVHNAKGGCSDWRSADIFKQEHAKMLELWPTIVSVKSDTDVRYNWRRAKVQGGLLS